MTRQSRLHIPVSSARPGERPDFSYLQVSPAGAVARPSIDAEAGSIQDLAHTLIRVLDETHHAVGPWDPALSADVLRSGLRYMLLTRLFDNRMLKSQRQGKISFYVQSTGEEAVAVAGTMALNTGDMLFPSYRFVIFLLREILLPFQQIWRLSFRKPLAGPWPLRLKVPMTLLCHGPVRAVLRRLTFIRQCFLPRCIGRQ